MNCYRDIKMEFLIITVLLLMSKTRTGDSGGDGGIIRVGLLFEEIRYTYSCLLCLHH